MRIAADHEQVVEHQLVGDQLPRHPFGDGLPVWCRGLVEEGVERLHQLLGGVAGVFGQLLARLLGVVHTTDRPAAACFGADALGVDDGEAGDVGLGGRGDLGREAGGDGGVFVEVEGDQDALDHAKEDVRRNEQRFIMRRRST